MSYIQEQKQRFKYFFCLWFFIGIGFMIWMLPETRVALSSVDWPQVRGAVTGVNSESSRNSENKWHHRGLVAYEYMVDGRQHTSTNVRFGKWPARSTRADAMADVSAYRPGMPVQVHYNPADRSIATLETGLPPVRMWLWIGMTASTLIGAIVLVMTVLGWLRSREPSERFSAE